MTNTFMHQMILIAIAAPALLPQVFWLPLGFIKNKHFYCLINTFKHVQRH